MHPAVQKNPHHLVRQAKKWLDEQRNYRLLWNLADAGTFSTKTIAAPRF